MGKTALGDGEVELGEVLQPKVITCWGQPRNPLHIVVHPLLGCGNPGSWLGCQEPVAAIKEGKLREVCIRRGWWCLGCHEPLVDDVSDLLLGVVEIIKVVRGMVCRVVKQCAEVPHAGASIEKHVLSWVVFPD